MLNKEKNKPRGEEVASASSSPQSLAPPSPVERLLELTVERDELTEALELVGAQRGRLEEAFPPANLSGHLPPPRGGC